MKLAHPKNMVVAEDVSIGKPGGCSFYGIAREDLSFDKADPECYQLGKSRLGLSADACVLVIEDSPAGIAAGKAAGCKVIGLATTHSIAQLRAVRPDWIVQDLRSVKFIGDATEVTGEVRIEISNSFLAAL